MKRFGTIGLTVILAFLIPCGFLNAQEKKSEQKIKIVVADKSGTTVEIDTVIKSDIPVESIKMNNGEVIYLSSHGSVGTVKHIESGNGEIYVTVASSEGNSGGVKYIYINEDKENVTGGEKSIDVKVTTDEKGNNVEKTKYVIAKDGIVVTVEGDDEAKVKEIIKSVESKLGVNQVDKDSKGVVKEETKKTTKK
jgi:hypothetical protein